jgi:hypothetical protein
MAKKAITKNEAMNAVQPDTSVLFKSIALTVLVSNEQLQALQKNGKTARRNLMQYLQQQIDSGALEQ